MKGASSGESSLRRDNGGIYNDSTTSTITVSCPITTPSEGQFMVTVGAKDMHNTLNVRCWVYNRNRGTGSYSYNYLTTSGSSTSGQSLSTPWAAHLYSSQGNSTYMHCQLPPKLNNQRSGLAGWSIYGRN